MRDRDVVALEVVVRDDLPVGGLARRRLGEALEAARCRRARAARRGPPSAVAQRRRVEVEVDPDEAGEDLDPGRHEPELRPCRGPGSRGPRARRSGARRCGTSSRGTGSAAPCRSRRAPRAGGWRGGGRRCGRRAARRPRRAPRCADSTPTSAVMNGRASRTSATCPARFQVRAKIASCSRAATAGSTYSSGSSAANAGCSMAVTRSPDFVISRMIWSLSMALPWRRDDIWLSLTPEPERLLPEARAVLRSGQAPPPRELLERERAQAEALVLRARRARWEAWLRESAALAAGPARTRPDRRGGRAGARRRRQPRRARAGPARRRAPSLTRSPR